MATLCATGTSAALPSRRRQRALRSEPERGSASVELALLFPALLLVVTSLVQYGLWFHARSLALAAAQHGVSVARSYDADHSTAPAAARAFVDAHGADTLVNVATTPMSAGPGEVGVEVTGRAISILPGIPGPPVRQAAEAPIERFTTAGAP
ncbi:membrane protein [Cellulomonas cellasea DSM 20118]|uniref:Membrane protein n=1 Tax=Cellulomonas cellasea DSM 20118 TaxID=1408250 RepID=A0A0A0BCY6_9CELL|nr:membrane protein [Cellulomonas cellasea DSM 20118]